MGGAVAGSALIFEDTHNTDQGLVGAGLLLTAVLVGTPLAITGSLMHIGSDAMAIDAVNLYNDERASCAAHP